MASGRQEENPVATDERMAALEAAFTPQQVDALRSLADDSTTGGDQDTHVLLEGAFTPEQVAALRESGVAGGRLPTNSTMFQYTSLKLAFGRLTEAPTNWQ